MKTYEKIETIYKRDVEGTKKLIEGDWRDPLFYILQDVKWYFTEKVDGTNVRVMWDGYKVSFGGRTEKTSHPAELIEHLEKMFGGTVNEQIFEQLFGDKEVIIFGEGYGGKIQGAGKHYRPDVSFIIFDVCVNGIYLERENIVEIANAFDVPVVPIVFKGTLKEAVEFIKLVPTSQLSITDYKMEGIVGKPAVEIYNKYGKRAICKIKVCDFVEGKE